MSTQQRLTDEVNRLGGLVADLRRELEHYKRLEAIVEGRSDVRDGPEGQQLPNDAMSILTEWKGMA